MMQQLQHYVAQPIRTLRFWLAVVCGFLFGQGLIQALTLLVGLLLMRLLPIDQYALYTVAGTLLAVVSMGSNFGLAQAIVSLGSSHRDDKRYVGALLDAARRLARRLMVPAMACTAVLAYFMLRAQDWPLAIEIVCVGLVFLVGVAQVESSLGRAVLNIHHDAHAIFHVGIAEVGARLLLLPLCVLWPVAPTALAANLAGAMAASLVTARRSGELSDRFAKSDAKHEAQLTGFVLPIAPVFLYTLAQGQIAILLLSAFAETKAIAETGALSRLGQAFAVIMLLNPFLVQPVFARIASHGDFVTKTMTVVMALILLCIVTMASAFVVPQWWLLILGDKYNGLTHELPVALATSLATVVGGTLCTMVIARGSTRWQSAVILPCLGGQLAFVAANGVRSTRDALVLSLIPAVAYAVVQAALLLLLLRRGTLQRRSA